MMKGGDEIMANFLVYRILDEKLTYAQVPASLKNDVKRILVDLGYEDLAK